MKKQIKLIKDYTAVTENGEELIPTGSIIELIAEVADALIADGVAEEYTEEVKELEKEEIEKETNKEAKAMAVKVVETKKVTTRIVTENKMNVFGKAIKTVVEGKATGMSGSAALSGKDATDVLGVIAAKSVIFGKARKIPINGNLSVIYSKAASGNPTVLPVIGIVSEGTAGATTVPIGQYDAIPYKWFATVAVTSEMLEDVPSLEAAIISEIQTALGQAIDNSALIGPFTNNVGMKGVIVDDNAVEAIFAAIAAPTVTELTAMTGKVNPMLHPNCEWYINPAQWTILEAKLLDSNNLANQLIKTGKEKELLGFPVNISFAVPSDHPMVFGDFSQYAIGTRKEIEITRDESVLFNTDETMLKIRVRLCGGLAAGVCTYEGASYAAITFASDDGS